MARLVATILGVSVVKPRGGAFGGRLSFLLKFRGTGGMALFESNFGADLLTV